MQQRDYTLKWTQALNSVSVSDVLLSGCDVREASKSFSHNRPRMSTILANATTWACC